MKSKWIIALAVLTLTAGAFAQGNRGRGGDAERGRARGGGLERGPGGPRGDFGRGPGGRGMMSFDQITENLATELGLSESQRAQYEEIVTRYVDQIDQHRASREQMRQLAMDYREARQSGDMDRADALRDQMRELGGGRREMMEGFFNDVRAIVTPEQAATLDSFRDSLWQRMQGEGRGRPDLRTLVRTLPDALEMTDTQRVAFDELIADYRAGMDERRDQWRELQPLRRQMREARQAGDEARVAELEKQLSEMRPQEGDDVDALLDRVANMLTDAQKAKLEELRAQYGESRRRGGEGSLRQLTQAAQRLDLKPEQRDQLRTLLREANRGRNLPPEEMAAQVDQLKQQILDILDAEQAAQFEELLQQAQQRERGRDRGGERQRGGERAGRGAGGPR